MSIYPFYVIEKKSQSTDQKIIIYAFHNCPSGCFTKLERAVFSRHPVVYRYNLKMIKVSSN